MLSAPTSTAPARRSAATACASRAAGGRSRLILDPASVVMPATSKRFLTAKGSPASGPGSPPAASAASTRSASPRACSASTVVNALIAAPRVATWARAASVTERALTRRARIAAIRPMPSEAT